MRIFSAQPYYPFDRDLNSALVEMGHDLVVKTKEYSGPAGDATRKERKEYGRRMELEKPGINKRWIEEVKRAHEKKKVDLFISATDQLITYPETIEKIKDLGIPTLNLAHDDIPEGVFMEQCKDLALTFDYNWTLQMSAIGSYKKIGAKVIYSPLGVNPYYCKYYDCKRDIDVVFLGRNKGYRRNIIKLIADEGIDIRTFGDGWRDIEMTIGLDLQMIRASNEKIRKFAYVFGSELIWHIKHFNKILKIFGPYLSFDDMIKMYSRCKITLNFPGYFEVDSNDLNIDFDNAIKGIKGRDFEAPMCGAFYLTEHSDEIGQLYKIGEEIETYRNVSELKDKIKYYLENPDEAESIRKAGRERALRDYTWVKRLEEVFDKIGISE